jgi:type IV pilus assembly protein PilV
MFMTNRRANAMNSSFRSGKRSGKQMGTQSGMTMLEVLIAIVVLSVGMLGMLGLMMNSLKLTTTSTYRAIATQHATGMAEAIRASVPSIFHYNNPTAGVTTTCFDSGGCGQPNLSGSELALWRQQLAETLPGDSSLDLGTVCRSTSLSGTPSNWNCSGSATAPVMVKVCWDETRVGVHSGTTPGTAYYECIYTQL